MERSIMIADYQAHLDCPDCIEALEHMLADPECVGECAAPSPCLYGHEEHIESTLSEEAAQAGA